MSISAYLRSCQGVLRSIANGGVTQGLAIVIGNESADLDSCVSSIAYGYLQSIVGYSGRTVIPVLNLPREDIKLRLELSLLLKSVDLLETDLICRDELPKDLKANPNGLSFILVDHNHFKVQDFDGKAARIVGIVDHHVDEGLYQDASPRIVQACGSCTSLVVNHFRGLWENGLIASETQLTQLVLSAILVDTSRLTNQVTETDLDVVKLLKSRLITTQDWSEDRQYKLLRDAKRNNEGLTVRQLLKRDYKEWDLGPEIGLWGISSVTTSLEQILSMDHWQEDVAAHEANQHLDVHMIMTKHGEKELVIQLANEDKLQYLQKFLDLAVVQMMLKPWKEGVYAGPKTYAFQQGDLSATRKKVATICQAIRE